MKLPSYPQSLQDPKMGGSRLAKMADEEEELGTSGHEVEQLRWSSIGAREGFYLLCSLLLEPGLRARDFPTERVLSRTPLIIRTVDHKPYLAEPLFTSKI